MSEEIVLTPKGKKKLEDELEYLKVVKRKEVAERIKQAIDFGDLSENSEYDEAKNEQAQLEEKIAKINSTLKKAKVIDESEICLSKVSVGTKVIVKDLEDGEEEEYTIVGSSEADPADMKVSNASPIGKGLIDKKVGEKVDIKIPDGIIKYEVISIEKAD